jgi:hypothetical protein
MTPKNAGNKSQITIYQLEGLSDDEKDRLRQRGNNVVLINGRTDVDQGEAVLAYCRNNKVKVSKFMRKAIKTILVHLESGNGFSTKKIETQTIDFTEHNNKVNDAISKLIDFLAVNDLNGAKNYLTELLINDTLIVKEA